MEETQQQPLRPSFPPAGTAKWLFNASGGSAGGSSFGQDSGYSSYHSTTPNNTFNLSSRHGASATLATIDEANEGDCSMNDSAGSSSLGGGVCSNILTPKTAASIDQISNFHLTTPNSAVRPKRPIRRRFDFDCAGEADGSFVAPTTPERLPLSRSVSFDSSDTPLRTVNRSSQQSQLTPHKARGGHSVKRKLSSLRGKLYSDDGEGDAMASPEDACDENRANDLNDSLDCKRLDISPIPKVKRHKPNENITNLIRSSTPKTASSQPRFLVGSTENIDSNTVAPGAHNVAPVRKTFRKFQSFSPSKMQGNRQKSSLRPRQEDRGSWQQGNRPAGRTGGFGLTRHDPLAELELTPQKKTAPVGYVTPSKEQRVLTEIHPTPTKPIDYQPPTNLAGLINAPIILEDPSGTSTTQQLPERDDQLEQAITTFPTFEDFSMTPSKANLIDPELSPGEGGRLLYAAEDFVARHAVSNFSYGPTLNSIIEEESPIRGRREIGGIVGKLMPSSVARTPPSGGKLSSGRKPKRLGTKSTSSGSLKASPLTKGVRGVPASPKAAALRRANASLQNPPGMYCGWDQLNVLKRLYERNQDSLHILLDYLTDEDLVQVVQVSKGWKEIIQSVPKQWGRLQKFLKLLRGDKENHQQRRSSRAILTPALKAGKPSSGGFKVVDQAAKTFPAASAEGQLPAAATQADESCIVKRHPFKICNSLDSSSSSIGNCTSMASGSAQLYASFGSECGNATLPERRRRLSAANAAVAHSPPVSPSKIKFVNNQKVASHLKRSEQLRPCTRCRAPSRVIFARSSKNGQNKARFGAVAARLERSYTLPDWDTGHDLNGTIQNTLSAELHRNYGDGSNSGAARNNNDYSATCSSSSSSLNGSPDSVRKNLFNSGSGNRSNRSVSSAAPALAVVNGSTDGRRNSEPHLPDTVRNGERRRLRSGAKSVDHLTYPSATAVSSSVALGVRDSKCDYAVCSSCGFQFCIKCLCEFHPETVCPDLAPNSPSKEEDRGQPNVACSRQSRRSLQRLCRKL